VLGKLRKDQNGDEYQTTILRCPVCRIEKSGWSWYEALDAWNKRSTYTYNSAEEEGPNINDENSGEEE
jgi:hypothetical protein